MCKEALSIVDIFWQNEDPEQTAAELIRFLT